MSRGEDSLDPAINDSQRQPRWLPLILLRQERPGPGAGTAHLDRGLGRLRGWKRGKAAGSPHPLIPGRPKPAKFESESDDAAAFGSQDRAAVPNRPAAAKMDDAKKFLFFRAKLAPRARFVSCFPPSVARLPAQVWVFQVFASGDHCKQPLQASVSITTGAPTYCTLAHHDNAPAPGR